MVKIASKKFLGAESVYDLGVREDHNFLLSNGLVASNCFNKSHSTAYAYVTYQTAYLKANYPTEYMTALLSASSDSQEKVERYRENCQKMDITVAPPDINLSTKDFTIHGDRIVFGLSAVKNLGEGAIENILQAREAAGGAFKSLGDFCTLVDLRVVNRRALETLIYCGAFDELNTNRKQLINDLELTISWAQNRAKEKETGQTSIFDILTNETELKNTPVANAPSAASVADFSIQEKLKLEKEYLGFYICDHPLKAIQQSASILSPIHLSALADLKGKKKVCVVGLLTTVKKHMSKNGPMAFCQLEDINSTVEAIVFHNVYEKISEVLLPDIPLVIWGKLEQKDDNPQIIVDHAEKVESLKMVMIEIEPQQAKETVTHNKLKSSLKEQSGDRHKANIPVFLILKNQEQRLLIRLGQEFWVQNEEEAVKFLSDIGFNAQVQPLMGFS